MIVDEKTRSLFGDGVNVAARIQAMATPGGIAVSRALRDMASVRAEYEFIDGGEHQAKNVSRPLRIFHVRPQSGASMHTAAPLVPPATRIARRPSALVRAARHGLSARLTMRGPALWGAVAGVALLLAGGGYFAYQANMPATVSSVVLSLSAEQLEQALAERRKADALAHEKRQLEEVARRKAAVEGEAKRQAEAELERARQARQKAEEDLARLKADIEARRRTDTGPREQAEAALSRAAEEAAQRKAENEAAGLRQAEQEAQKKAAADALAKRQADEALARAEAARQRAEQEAQRKAETEQLALRRASEEQASAALATRNEEPEALEKGLRLDQTARARLQVALTALGFDARGRDGIFGPRTRDMIVAWQKARRHAQTGFLTAAQHQALLKEGATAVSTYDEQKNAEDEARTRATVSVSSATLPPSALLALPSSAGNAGGAKHEGSYWGLANVGSFTSSTRPQVSLQMANGRGVGALGAPGCQQSKFVVAVSPTGVIDGQVYFNCVVAAGSSTVSAGEFKIVGEYRGKEIQLSFRSARTSFGARLTTAASPVASAPSIASSDGSWRGAYACGAAVGQGLSSSTTLPFTIPLEFRVSNGLAIWKSTNASEAAGGTLEIRLLVSGNSVSVTRVYGVAGARGTLSGRHDGNGINAAGRGPEFASAESR